MIEMERETSRRAKRWKILFLVTGGLSLFYFFLYWAGTARFETTFYQIDNEKVKNPVRIVAISDLHNTTFGKNNCKLIERIVSLEPDLITILGDMNVYGDENIDVVVSLCEQLVEIAPVCYTYGNHENEMVFGSDMTGEFMEALADQYTVDEYGTIDYSRIAPVDARLPEALERLGVLILNNNSESIRVEEVQVDVVGIDNLSGTYFPYSYHIVEEVLDTEPQNLKLILTHRPLLDYAISFQEDLHYDLILCGHTHGGIIRLPGVGGMFAEGGFWPWFTGKGREAGCYKTDQGSVIVSRGMGNRWPIPRINNVPELVVVDFN